MDSFMKYINRIHRCAGRYRSARLPDAEIGSHRHIYIFHVCRQPGIAQEQLAKLICVNKSNVTRQINFLEQQGYVFRRPDESDRRILRIYPTQRAEELYPKVLRIMREWNMLLLAELAPQEQEQLLDILARITERAIRAAEGEAVFVPERAEEYENADQCGKEEEQ